MPCDESCLIRCQVCIWGCMRVHGAVHPPGSRLPGWGWAEKCTVLRRPCREDTPRPCRCSCAHGAKLTILQRHHRTQLPNAACMHEAMQCSVGCICCLLDPSPGGLHGTCCVPPVWQGLWARAVSHLLHERALLRGELRRAHAFQAGPGARAGRGEGGQQSLGYCAWQQSSTGISRGVLRVATPLLGRCSYRPWHPPRAPTTSPTPCPGHGGHPVCITPCQHASCSPPRHAHAPPWAHAPPPSGSLMAPPQGCLMTPLPCRHAEIQLLLRSGRAEDAMRKVTSRMR